jgi:CubicO group peptidase (beta-lactamase class C family)
MLASPAALMALLAAASLLACSASPRVSSGRPPDAGTSSPDARAHISLDATPDASSDATPDAATVDAGPNLPTASPESEGYSSAELNALLPYLAEIHSLAGMVVVGGKVIFTWGDVTMTLAIHSIRKSFLSALYGRAVESGQISLSSTLGQLGINDVNPALTPTNLTCSVLDLIESTSGIYHAANYAPTMQTTDRPDANHLPGTYWFYNNWDFNAAGAVYEKVTTQSIFGAFEAQIAAPIGMQDYTPADGAYEWTTTSGQEVFNPSDGPGTAPSSAVSILPAYTFNMSTRDMARFGLLYLGHGSWNGNQVVPASWVAESTQTHWLVTPIWNAPPGAGYGYLWWTGADAGGGLFFDAATGPGAFAAEGSGGHYIVTIPEYDMVVVNRADDAYYEEDETTNDIGFHRMGLILAGILGAKE